MFKKGIFKSIILSMISISTIMSQSSLTVSAVSTQNSLISEVSERTQANSSVDSESTTGISTQNIADPDSESTTEISTQNTTDPELECTTEVSQKDTVSVDSENTAETDTGSSGVIEEGDISTSNSSESDGITKDTSDDASAGSANDSYEKTVGGTTQGSSDEIIDLSIDDYDTAPTPEEITEYIINGDFETGDLTGWYLMDGTDATNDNNNVGIVSDETTYWGSRNMYIHGKYCLRGESLEFADGQIRSSDFRLGGDGYISFMIGSASKEGRGSVKLYEVTKDGDNLIRTYTNTRWNDPKTGLTLIRMFDKLDDEYLGHIFYFVIENGKEAGFSFINADDFRTSMTRNEVEELQESQLTEIADVEDEYSDYIISCYKKNGILNDDVLKKEAPESITQYEGQTVNIKDLITNEFKIEKSYSKEPVEVTIDIDSIVYNANEITDIEDNIKLKKGKYVVIYTATYGDVSLDKTIDIVVNAIDKNINEVENGDFETGDLTGWEVLTPGVWNKDGEGNYEGVVSEESYWNEKLPFNQTGNYHLDGWHIADNESDTWGIKSSAFTLSGSGFISVKMSGNAASFCVYELDGTLVGEYRQNRFRDINFPYIANGGSWADMGTYFVDLSDYIGETLYIELHDNTVSGGWAVAFFDDVRTYYETAPDVANGYDTVIGPVGMKDNQYEYDNINIPWTMLSYSKGNVKLSFEDDNFNVANSEGQHEIVEISSNLKEPAFQDKPVLPYRPDGVKGKALMFDGYTNYAEFAEHISGAQLTVDAYICPRAFMWDNPATPRQEQIAQVIAGSYDSAAKTGFMLGITKHGYITFRIGTGDNWYSLSSDDGKKVKLYKWNHVTGVFDGKKGYLKIYLNGQEVGKLMTSGNNSIVDSGKQIRIGKGSESIIVADNMFDGTMFPGLMDEVTITMDAWSDSEVADNSISMPDIQYMDARIPASYLRNDYYRPLYHAAPPANWMNEPHTLFNFNGKWHLFYQSNQEGPYWHNISWGHWVSDDKVNWECVQDAVVPMDDTVAIDGVWTGNVIFSADGKPMLLITAGDDSRSINNSNQHVGLARAADYSDPDLTEWEVVGFAMAQDSLMGTAGEFRDAQCFGIGNERYMVVGGAIDGKGAAHIFKTTARTADEWTDACRDGALNGMDWEYKGSLFGDFYDSHNYKSEYGTVWELPNLVPLTDVNGKSTDKYLFVFSPQHGDNDVWYYIGDFDTDTCKFTPDFEDARLMDYGNNIFTGPTVYINPEDKFVYINSVMQENAQGEEDRPISDHQKAGWAFYAGLTRRLFLKSDGTLGITHVDTSSIEGETIVSFKDKKVTEANEILHNIDSDCIKIDFAITGEADEMGLYLKKSDTNASKLYLTKNKLGLDNQSGEYKRKDTVKGTVYIDRCSVESYIDDSITISGSKFFRGGGLEVFADDDSIISMTVTKMNSIKMNQIASEDSTNSDSHKKDDAAANTDTSEAVSNESEDTSVNTDATTCGEDTNNINDSTDGSGQNDKDNTDKKKKKNNKNKDNKNKDNKNDYSSGDNSDNSEADNETADNVTTDNATTDSSKSSGNNSIAKQNSAAINDSESEGDNKKNNNNYLASKKDNTNKGNSDKANFNNGNLNEKITNTDKEKDDSGSLVQKDDAVQESSKYLTEIDDAEVPASDAVNNKATISGGFFLRFTIILLLIIAGFGAIYLLLIKFIHR